MRKIFNAAGFYYDDKKAFVSLKYSDAYHSCSGKYSDNRSIKLCGNQRVLQAVNGRKCKRKQPSYIHGMLA